MKKNLSALIFIFYFVSQVYAQGSGNVLSYNGTNQYINLGTLVAGNCRSIEFWFKPSTLIDGSIPDAISLLFRDYNNGDAASINEFGFYFKPSSWNQGGGGCLFFSRRIN